MNKIYFIFTREEVTKELKSALSSIKLSERGVYVQASTLGSLEALLEFLKGSKIPVNNIRINSFLRLLKKNNDASSNIVIDHK